jgi:pimeloyl-ACP methyl ester carboxylesterase
MALRGDSTGLLPEIKCPVLVLVGEQDSITPLDRARAIFERIPQAELEVIPEAAHISNMERPDIFSGPIARFLRERIGGASQRA